MGRGRKSGFKLWHAILLVIIFFGAWWYGLLPFAQVQPPATTETSNLVDVNKPLKFAVIDQFAGSAVASATVKVYEGTTLKESLTTGSDGTVTSALNYPSGTVLNILVTKSNSKCYYQITVPKMSPDDAQALTYNPIELKFFTLASVSLAVRDSSGNSYSSGGNLNITTLGTSITLTISWYVSSDNTGYKSSYDPINDLNWYPVLYAKTTGTNYETLDITGFDGAYSIGTNNWYYHVLDDTEITKYKVGNTYVYSGTGSLTISLDATGYSGDLADLILYLVVYTDPVYHQNHASFGPDYVQLATFTLNIVD